MTSRSKISFAAAVAVAAAFVILNLPHAPTVTVAADRESTTVIKHYAPASAIDWVEPADGAGTSSLSLTSDGQ